jgi:hypothetical protein
VPDFRPPAPASTSFQLSLGNAIVELSIIAEGMIFRMIFRMFLAY